MNRLRTAIHALAQYVFVFALVLLAMLRVAGAETPAVKSTLCGLNSTELDGLSGDASVSIDAVYNYGSAVYGLLRAGKIEQLDCLADSVRSSKARFPGGMWKIHAFYFSLRKPPLHATSEDWKEHIALLDRWVSAKPESITARVALAAAYIEYGQDARGNGYADTVSENGWKLLAERTTKAKQILDDAAALQAKDPEWYCVMMDVARWQQWEKSAKRELFEKAVKFDPTYYYYYRLYADSLQTKWDGEEGELANFLQKTANKIGGDAGDIIYFRVAGTLICGCQGQAQLNLSWERIKKGFAANEKEYGQSQDSFNLMAHMAPSFGDAVIADKMFTRIGDQWDKALWRDFSYFDGTRQWAKAAAPHVAKKQAAEQSAQENLLTAEGQKYNTAFSDNIQDWLKPCIDALNGSDPGTFELLVKIGKEGTLEEMTGDSHSATAPCLGHKLKGFQDAKQVVFPPPPKPDYWVRFDLTPEPSAPLALR